MTAIYARKKGTEFEIGDIIDVSMSIDYQIPPEDEEKSVIDLNDYDAKYEIHYSFPRKLGFSTVDFSV